MIGISEKQFTPATNLTNHDFALGIKGFNYSDLYDAERLAQIAEEFYAEIEIQEPVLHEALVKYITRRGEGYEKRVESKILTDSAPYLSDFVARMFNLKQERAELQDVILAQNPIWKYKFFVQRRAIKKFTAEDLANFNEAELDIALNELKNTAFDETLICDEELAVAQITTRLLEAEELLAKNLELTVTAQDTIDRIKTAYEKLKDKVFGTIFARFVTETEGAGEMLEVKAILHLLEAWSAIAFFKKEKKWYSFKTPHGVEYQNLVHLIHPAEKIPELLRGADEEMRRRDGFK